MKPQNNDLKGLCFSVILIVSGVLTYFGTYTYYDPDHCSLWVRLAGIPALLAIWLCKPQPDAGYFVAVAGSGIFYFAVGTALLLLIERWIKKHREKKKNKPNDI
jgi:hypothetical protein